MSKVNLYDELIMSYLDGLCTSEDAQILLSWIAESDENRCHFESLKSVWELTAFDMPENIDVEAALQNVNLRIDEIEAEKTVETAPVVQLSWYQRNYKYVSGVAAAVVVALIVGFFVANPFNGKVVLASGDFDANTPCVLPDGTSVVFDSESELTYRKSFGKTMRQVDFEGVASFDVAKDANKPFIIRCDNMQIEVLGTSFLLNAEDHVVDLYSGKVKMSAVDQKGNEISSIEILPGERGVLAETDELVLVSAMDVKKDELMKNHELVFNDETLRVIIETVEYIYNVNINLAESQAERKITVRFTDDSINDVLETIAAVANLELVKSGSSFELR
ncbi:MAG: FecR family protein [Bacteroidales bacterium]|nr:FecR family protein [Bacteroidales bacterium]